MWALLEYLGFINLVIAIFNLIPAFPTDGGRVLRAILWHISGNVVVATRRASFVGRFLSIMLIVTGLTALFSGQIVAGIWQVLIGVFLYLSSRASYEQVMIHRLLANQTVRDLMTYTVHTADVKQSIRSVVDDIFFKHNVSFAPVTEGKNLVGYVDTSLIRSLKSENWDAAKLKDVMIKCNEDNTVSPNTLTEDVFNKMNKTGQRKFMISENGRLLGVITLSDLMSYLAIRVRFNEGGRENKMPKPRKYNA